MKKLKMVGNFNKNILYTNKISFKFLDLSLTKNQFYRLILNIYFKEKSL